MNTQFLGSCLILSLSVAPVWAQADKVSLRPRVSGVLKEVHVKAGAAVQKGDLLFELDATVLRAELAKVQAEVAVAEAKVMLQVIEATNAQKLLEQKVISRAEYERNLTQRNIAKANLEVVRASLDLAKIRLDFTKIRAPISGTFVRPLIAIGNVVKADETILGEIVHTPAKASAEVRALQKERLALLKEALEVTIATYKSGRSSLDALLQAQREAHDATLELCNTQAERMDHARKNVELAKFAVSAIEARRKAGIAGQADVLQARAALLDARIRLLREGELAEPWEKK